MEAKIFQSLHLSASIGSEKIVAKPSGNSLRFSLACGKKQRLEMHVSSNLQPSRHATRHGPIALKVSSCTQQFPASVLESGNLPSTLEEDVILKNKSEDIEPLLSGRCIYLVGMMGSGKTTVGKILSEGLGYDFVDCDFLIEKAVGGTSVSEIFKLHGESFFRKNETEMICQLSQEHRLVISTGGGAVIRPINWKFMHKGVCVWLDVPLEALARRITAVGTDSRPLLQQGSGDAYEKTFKRLSALLEERGEAYANASARVSLENIAAKLGYKDVCDISPTMIAIEALVQIERFLKK